MCLWRAVSSWYPSFFSVKCSDVPEYSSNLCLVYCLVGHVNYLKNFGFNLRATSVKRAYYGLNRSLNIPPKQSNMVCVESCECQLGLCCTLLTVVNFLAVQSALLHKHHTGILLCWPPRSSTLCKSVKEKKLCKSVIKFLFSSVRYHLI